MKRSIRILICLAAVWSMALSVSRAGDLTLPYTFQSGTPAVAAEVNGNFSAVETAVDDNDSRVTALEAALAALQTTVAAQAVTISDQTSKISALQTSVSSQAATIAALQGDLAAVQGSQVMALESYLTVDETSDSRGPLVQLSGANLQILNGLGSTDTINGLGNLIIGYDEASVVPYEPYLQCSDGAYADESSCVSGGGTWGYSFKNGSHYLVLGTQNNYAQYGGLVAGIRNFSVSRFATVTGGGGNSARGFYSSISGGALGIAGGDYSSVSGGEMRMVTGNDDWRAGSLFEDC